MASANEGLPVELQLVIPFLKAGELKAIAAVNKAFRLAALESYQTRLQTPLTLDHALIPNDESTTPIPTMSPQVFRSVGEVPIYYRLENPWGNFDRASDIPGKYGDLSYQNKNAWSKMDPASDMFGIRPKDSELQELGWRTGPNLFEWQATNRMHLPEIPIPNDSWASFGTPLHTTHCSKRGHSLLVLKENTYEGENPGSFLPKTTVELWGLLYDLHPDGKASDGKFHPVLKQQLMKKDYLWACSGEYPSLDCGQAVRSGDGKVFAAVTRLPLVTETAYDEPNSEDDYAEVTVYNITEDGFVQRHVIQVTTFRADNQESHLVLSLSSGGEILSILNREGAKENGSWVLYDTRGDVCQQIFQVPGFARCCCNTYFTPDNDFVVHLSKLPSNFHRSRSWITDHTSNFHPGDVAMNIEQSKDIPCFARSMVVYTAL